MEGKRVSVVKYRPLQRLGKWAARKRNVVRPVAFTAAFAFVLLVSGGIVHLNRLGHARDAAVAEAARAAQAERVAKVEAVNGRAAVGTAEALYGRAGVALEQLQQVRADMVALDTDTARADIGVGLLTRAALLPSVLLKAESGVQIGIFSADGSSFYVITEGVVRHIDFSTGQDLGRWKSPWPIGALGPIEDGSPWVLRIVDEGVHGVHLATGTEQRWTVPGGECISETLAVNNDWLSVGCAGRGLVVWPWTEPEAGRLYPFSDTRLDAAELSDDGRRVRVSRFQDSHSVRDSFVAVVEGGRVVWEDHTRGVVFGLSPDGEWILKMTTTGFEVTHIDSGVMHSVQSKVVGIVVWHRDSSKVSLALQEGAVKVFDVGLEGVSEASEHRLAIKGGVHALFVDASLERWVHIDRTVVRVFEARAPDRPLVDLHLDDASIAVGDVVRSASGDLLAVGTENGQIFVLDRHTGVKLWSFSTPLRPIRGLSFLPSEKKLVSGHWDGKARVWDLTTGQLERVFEPTNVETAPEDLKVTEVNALDNERVLLACGDGQIGIWSISTGELLKDLTGDIEYVWDSAWSAVTGRLILSNRMGRSSGVVAAIYDLNTGELLKTIDGHYASAYGVGISPNGEQFGVTMSDFSALVLDSNGEIEAELSIHTPPALEMAWSSDGSLVATSDYSGKFQLWATRNWAPVASVGLDDLVSSLIFDPNRRFLLAVTYSGEVHELDLGGRPEDWTTFVQMDGEPVADRELHEGAWRIAARVYDWPRALAEMEAAMAAGLSVSPVEVARYRLAGGDRAGALAAIGAVDGDDGVGAVWRGALGSQLQ
jgi:WD40 repeat protein